MFGYNKISNQIKPHNQIKPQQLQQIMDYTGLPADLANIIGEYSYLKNFEVMGIASLDFSEDGQVLNPERIPIIKDGFTTMYCHAEYKAGIFYDAFHYPNNGRPYWDRVQKVVRQIFEEISASGQQLILDGIKIPRLRMEGLDFSNASMTDCEYINSTFVTMNLTGADLQRSVFNNCHLLLCDLTNANLTGANLSTAKLVGCKLDGAIGISESGATIVD